MSFTDNSIDIAIALGKGIYSVGEDIVFGIERTGEGLGLGEDGSMDRIAYENRAMVSIIESFFKYGISDKRNPLYKSIFHILEHYYSYFPDEVIDILAKQAGIGAGYTVGRMVIGKKLATTVATKIAIAIAATATYKQIAKRIGVSAGASATGIGIPISIFMIQGVMKRSSDAAERLRRKSPKLYRKLKQNGDLQLLYFLLEKPLEKHIDSISLAEKSNIIFQDRIKRTYGLN